MAVYVQTIPVAVDVNEVVPYNAEIIKGCCDIRHREGSGVVNVKGNCCKANKYRVHFHGNVTGVAGPITLGIFEDGELLQGTEMNVVPVAADSIWSVDAETVIKAECSCNAISIRLIQGTPVTVNSATLVVEKEV